MTIREALVDDARDIAGIHIESWRATYRGIVPEEYLAALSLESNTARQREAMARPKAERWVLVAEDDAGRVTGFAQFGRERDGTPGFDGELYAIYLHPGTQRMGTGRALLAACARKLKEHGFGSMLVWVLAENPSRFFYERCGGALVSAKQITIGGAALEEISYGWKDIGALCGTDQVTKKNASASSA